MTPAQSERELRQRFGTPLGHVRARPGIYAMLSFYNDRRVDGVIEVDDGDMLLLQWGTYDFGGPATFQINITRQFIVPDQDEPYQLSLTFHYSPDGPVASIKGGNKWCHSAADGAAFRTFATQLPALSAVDQFQPTRVELTYGQA